jgi:glutamyl-tRNA reductase
VERLAVVGLSWRQGGAQAIGRFTIPPSEQPDRLRAMRDELGVPGLVYLATCNRVEWIVDAGPNVPVSRLRSGIFRCMTGRDPEPGEAERCFREWAGEGAVEHLFLVATGLDSAKIGETDVQSQVRGATERAREIGLTSPLLELVLEESLHVARKVRRATDLGQANASLAEIAEACVREHLAEQSGPVALVGVTKITERCARALTGAGVSVTLVNRTRERAEALAAEIGARAQALADFRLSPGAPRVIVSATGSPETVLPAETLRAIAGASASGTTLILDLAIPPDVDPFEARAAGLRRIGMDEIITLAERQRSERLIDAAESRALIDEAVDAFQSKLADWSLGPAFTALQRHYHDAAIESAEKVLRRELRTLGAPEQEAVRKWAEALARRLAHLPTAGLRGLAHELGVPAVETFLSNASPELLRTVRHERAADGRGRSAQGDPSFPDGQAKGACDVSRT